MLMAGSRSCGGRAFQDNGLDEENAREPNVDVDCIAYIAVIVFIEYYFFLMLFVRFA